MRCTQDGEPSHEVYLGELKLRAKFERPPKDGKLEEFVNQWIDRFEERK